MDLGREVIASWIWEVVNPQIAQCDYASSLLERTLTFRPHEEGFERLQPLGDVLSPEGRVIFEDIEGDIPEYDDAIARHDEALERLRDRALALYRALIDSDAFRAAVDRANPAPLDRDAEEVTRYFASYVVNQIGDMTRVDSIFADAWNAARDELGAIAATTTLVAPLSEQRAEFSRVVLDTRARLAALRKQWSRKYDIPAAPVRRILETPAD